MAYQFYFSMNEYKVQKSYFFLEFTFQLLQDSSINIEHPVLFVNSLLIPFDILLFFGLFNSCSFGLSGNEQLIIFILVFISFQFCQPQLNIGYILVFSTQLVQDRFHILSLPSVLLLKFVKGDITVLFALLKVVLKLKNLVLKPILHIFERLNQLLNNIDQTLGFPLFHPLIISLFRHIFIMQIILPPQFLHFIVQHLYRSCHLLNLLVLILHLIVLIIKFLYRFCQLCIHPYQLLQRFFQKSIFLFEYVYLLTQLQQLVFY